MNRLLLAGVALAFCSSVSAQWTLLGDESSISYVSIKNSLIGEVNGFKRISGSISEAGALALDIDLTSVETQIPIRNDRMQSMLFNAEHFPSAGVNATLDAAAIASMQTGETATQVASFRLGLHGMQAEMTANVRIVKLADNQVLAVSTSPVIVSAAQFGLTEGVEKLREVAGLSSISAAVPVTFSLVFQKPAR